MKNNSQNLYIAHLSLHGLIRGHNLELGSDADTGGQCQYVLELVKELGMRPEVGRVDLITRKVIDAKVSSDYAVDTEHIGGAAYIQRISAGPKRYLRKEILWRHLGSFIDECLALFRRNGRLPDLIHAHYADAGFVGSRLASLLGCPFIYTGHSLGRTKRQKLLEKGSDSVKIEKLYNLNTRIEAEEISLDTASMVCTSTHQEISSQYEMYDFYQPDRMQVIPPGVNVSRFSPPSPNERLQDFTVFKDIAPFLRDPQKPLILAIARADQKKNLASLVTAYAESDWLKENANLCIVAGNRDHLKKLNNGARKVMTELLHLIDDHNLYGKVALPKHHTSSQIPEYYKLATALKGVFVNPALTEPFGLTLLEAAASGLPVLATNDGGPQDILENCQNGFLIKPLEVTDIVSKLERILQDPDEWSLMQRRGIQGISDHYTWSKHAERYLELITKELKLVSNSSLISERARVNLPLVQKMLFTGLEEAYHPNDSHAIAELNRIIKEGEPTLGFGVATARSREEAVDLIKRLNLPAPDVLICELGGHIQYGKNGTVDKKWANHIRYNWEPERVKEVLSQIEGLSLQNQDHQSEFKISYTIDETSHFAKKSKVQQVLRAEGLRVKVLLTDKVYLDIIPLRAGKVNAMRYVCLRWGIELGQVLSYARRGSDYEIIHSKFLTAIGSDHNKELSRAQTLPRVYKSEEQNYSGFIDAINAYHFTGNIQVPQEARGLLSPSDSITESTISPDQLGQV